MLRSQTVCVRRRAGGPAPLASPGNPREPLAPPRSHLGDGLASELRETLGLGLPLHGGHSRTGWRGGKRRLPEAEKGSAKAGPPRRGQTSNLGFTAEPELGGEGSAGCEQSWRRPRKPRPRPRPAAPGDRPALQAREGPGGSHAWGRNPASSEAPRPACLRPGSRPSLPFPLHSGPLVSQGRSREPAQRLCTLKLFFFS